MDEPASKRVKHTVLHDDLHTFALRCEQQVQSCWSSLPKTGKPQPHEHTILAAILVTLPTAPQSPVVVCLGTGTKCLPANKRCCDGSVLNDSHAEVIARRACIAWIVAELMEAVKKPDIGSALFAWNGSAGKFTLRDGVRFHMYISQPPCGDACIFNTGSEPVIKQQPVVLSLSSQPNSTIYPHATLQSKPGGQSHLSSESRPATQPSLTAQSHKPAVQLGPTSSVQSHPTSSHQLQSVPATAQQRDSTVLPSVVAAQKLMPEAAVPATAQQPVSTVLPSVAAVQRQLMPESAAPDQQLSARASCDDHLLTATCTISPLVATLNLPSCTTSAAGAATTGSGAPGSEGVVTFTHEEGVVTFTHEEGVVTLTHPSTSAAGAAILGSRPQELEAREEGVVTLTDVSTSAPVKPCDDGGGQLTSRTGAKPLRTTAHAARPAVSSDPRNCDNGSVLPSSSVNTQLGHIPQAHDVEQGDQALGVTRRKPGKGVPTLSMSCSDKIAKWGLLGLQGAILSGLLDKPLGISSLIVGCPVETFRQAGPAALSSAQASLHRAIVGRCAQVRESLAKDPDACCTDGEMMVTVVPPPDETLGWAPGVVRKSAAGVSVNWSTGAGIGLHHRTGTKGAKNGRHEVTLGADGRKAGAAKKGSGWNSPKTRSRLTKAAVMDSAMQLLGMLPSQAVQAVLGGADVAVRSRSYRDLKHDLGARYQAGWRLMRGLSHSPFALWIDKPAEQESFSTVADPAAGSLVTQSAAAVCQGP